MTLVAELRTSVLPAIMRRAHDRAQLATDMDYLCTIAAVSYTHLTLPTKRIV